MHWDPGCLECSRNDRGKKNDAFQFEAVISSGDGVIKVSGSVPPILVRNLNSSVCRTLLGGLLAGLKVQLHSRDVSSIDSLFSLIA